MSKNEIEPRANSDATQPGRAQPNVAFQHAMDGAKSRISQLSVAINNHDFEEVEYLAREAANMWLTGRAACRRLLERAKPSSPYGMSARELLQSSYTSLLEMYGRAEKTIEVPRMRRVLDELRGTLEAANATPLGTTTEASATADRKDAPTRGK